jgi:hypothetical protein
MIWQGWAKDFGRITSVANDPGNTPAIRKVNYLKSEKKFENSCRNFIPGHW